jgi:RNA polymerase sigma-70 factor (ECF subfamily)
LSTPSYSRNFEQDALPHLNNAYNLARWLTGNDQDAEDIVQEACLRAFKFYRGFRGGDARPWLLTIVRNVYYNSLQENPAGRMVEFDEDAVSVNRCFANPEEILIQNSSGALLRRAIETLPTRSREMLILRELDGMSYRQISNVVGVPTGTVMSRLSRARASLRQVLTDLMSAGPQTKATK